MFLRATKRIKDGKEHRYFSVVENVRHPGSKHPVQKPILYLGELNDSQQAAWSKALLVCDRPPNRPSPCASSPKIAPRRPILSLPSKSAGSNSIAPSPRLRRFWLAVELWRQLGLDAFWTEKLGWTREGTDWAKTLLVSVAYRLIAPGSEWKCWRLWYERTAPWAICWVPTSIWATRTQLYAVLDRLRPHRAALFQHLRARWQDLFGVQYEVLLYDLTSTYFEGAGRKSPRPSTATAATIAPIAGKSCWRWW